MTVKEWEQLPREKSKHYALFMRFLSLQNRSLPALSCETGLSLIHLRKLSARFDWFDRAEKYDAAIMAMAQQKQIEQRAADLADFQQRQMTAAKELSSAALSLLRKLKDRIDQIQSSDIKADLIGHYARHCAYVLGHSLDQEAKALAVAELLCALNPDPDE